MNCFRVVARVLACSLAAATVLIAATAVAATIPADVAYPEKPISVVVGFNAGGGVDSIARMIAGAASEYLNNQPMIIVNKPGASQILSMKYALNADPDGYTLLFLSAGGADLATMTRDVGINFLKDFVPIAQMATSNLVIVSNKERNFKTPQDLINAIKEGHSTGRRLRYSHSGRGGFSHVAAEAWLKENGLSNMVQDLPVDSGAEQRSSVVGNHVGFSVFGLHNWLVHKSELDALGILAGSPDPLHPEVLTMAEQAIPFVEMTAPYVLVASKNTPREVIQVLEKAMEQVFNQERFRLMIENAGIIAQYANSDESAIELERLRQEWLPVVGLIRSDVEASDELLGAQIIPMVLLGLIGVGGLALGASALRTGGLRRGAVVSSSRDNSKHFTVPVVSLVGVSFVYVWLFQSVQYPLATLIAMPAAMLIFGNRGLKRVVAFPVALTGFYYALFFGLLGLTDTKGTILSYSNHHFFGPLRSFFGLH